eukprot:TRINITY_DN9755_c0_g1_i1.p1 TRINITY_DN9755_c0_g1~~TRINITY_DN9755_c0_g1_i1.p1  ORF type:complete len:275 (-),score=64.04 TRINITY_DN9755_c0_g1_i1:168-992(-)
MMANHYAPTFSGSSPWSPELKVKWTERGTSALIEFCHLHINDVRSSHNRSKESLWKNACKFVTENSDMPMSLNYMQCKSKWTWLCEKHMRERKTVLETGRSSNWTFFEQMSAIIQAEIPPRQEQEQEQTMVVSEAHKQLQDLNTNSLMALESELHAPTTILEEPHLVKQSSGKRKRRKLLQDRKKRVKLTDIIMLRSSIEEIRMAARANEKNLQCINEVVKDLISTQQKLTQMMALMNQRKDESMEEQHKFITSMNYLVGKASEHIRERAEGPC